MKMKAWQFLVIAVFSFFPSIFANEVRVMTFNTMCKLCDYKKNYGPFDYRLEKMADTIKRHNPDLIALQEMQNDRHVEKLIELLDGVYETKYRHFWLWPGTDSIILVKTARFEVLNREGIWLGPKAPKFNLGWKPRTPRKLEVTHLKDKFNGKEFMFYGIHLDSGRENREQAALFIADKIKNSELPVLLAGDSNIEPETDGFPILKGNMIDAFLDTASIKISTNKPMTSELNEACTDHGLPTFPACRIDHIFYTKNTGFKTKQWIVDTYRYFEDKWLVSDHRAVMSILEY